MTRQALTDGSGKWFDLEAAEKFDERSTWDGNNYISDATGSQWDHEELYRTAGGKWILSCSSQWSGSIDTWTEIDNAAAAAWLVVAGEEPHEACATEYAALELR